MGSSACVPICYLYNLKYQVENTAREPEKLKNDL